MKNIKQIIEIVKNIEGKVLPIVLVKESKELYKMSNIKKSKGIPNANRYSATSVPKELLLKEVVYGSFFIYKQEDVYLVCYK